MINRDLQLKWLERQKDRIEILKKDLKALTDSPYFGTDVWGYYKERIEGIKFNVTYSKPKVHWYNWHYRKSIDVELKTDIAINTIKKNLETEIAKEEGLYDKCQDSDFQEENCVHYRHYNDDDLSRYLHPGCKNCSQQHNCENYFDLKNKGEILARPGIGF